ncbi:MAG: cache domain-containing protein [Candidatus Cloacimonetes bacterium]|nr:cache domain-containing protein [Candidatus Cloacimonadota bacterium]MCF7813581.1 cache domain-containing protein [Candidatus Cloacimonadota bacterium]MCF7868212.1 cache domain-containing protein [Candidatus Cloacimonadota bacterium]MCF7883624.1 cache domain-containing protein [Candidatus Cloacimonadota bacterium]
MILKKMKLCFILALLLSSIFMFAENENSVENYELIAKYVVHTTTQGLGAALSNIESADEQIEFLRTYITPIRFYPDKTGYFYIYNFDCVNIAHATQKDLEGQNLYDYRDAKGKYVIRELSAASQNGGGYVEYYWQKPDDEIEYKKMGYVEPIPGTDYFIGTGVYLQ